MTWSSVAAPRSSIEPWENNTFMPQAHKWVYQFREGSAKMRDLLGGKGAGAAEMTRAGLPVPPGFTITTRCCNAYYVNNDFPAGMWEQVLAALAALEEKTGKSFGDPHSAVLASARSGGQLPLPATI